MKKSFNQTISQSWTMIGSLISLALVALFMFYCSRAAGNWIPLEWKTLAVGLGAGNIMSITLRLRTLKIYERRKTNG